MKTKKIVFAIVPLLLLSLYSTGLAAQPPGVTTAPYTVSYSARLVDSTGTAVTTAHQIRFSIWSDADVDATDYLVDGSIDPIATGFTGWEEEHTVTPDSNGLFHVQLGSITTLPNFALTTDIWLQVDVKANGLAKTAYETLDPDGDATAGVTDRHYVNSQAFAINSDTLDNRDAGYTAGDVPYLDGSALLPVSTIPGGTNADSFIIDIDDSVGAPSTIKLQFGSTLAKILEYDIANTYFNFNDDVNITGGLAVSGNVNFAGSTEFHMRQVADESTATCTTLDEMVLDTAENKIYICTATGSPGTWVAADTGSSSPFAHEMIFEPEYNDSIYAGDGTNNLGKLEIFFTDTDGDPGNNNYNYYKWTTQQATLQDFDLIIRTNLPTNFTGWGATPVQFTYKTADANTANNKIDISIEDTAGTAVTLTGAANLASASWTTASITYGGTPTWTAGEEITIKLKLSALSAGIAYAGNITLFFNGT